MSKYIRVPLNYHQLEKFKVIDDMVVEMLMESAIPYLGIWACGSSILKLFLGAKVAKNNDFDYMVSTNCTAQNIIYATREYDHVRRPPRKSKNAINYLMGTNKDKVQLIPVDALELPTILDTFDITLAAIGIEKEDDGACFVMHKDIYKFSLGLTLSTSFNQTEDLNMNHITRMVKYADKFKVEPEVLFKDFVPFLEQVNPMLSEVFTKNKKEFYVDIRDFNDDDSRYDANHLLSDILGFAGFNTGGFTGLAGRPRVSVEAFGRPMHPLGRDDFVMNQDAWIDQELLGRVQVNQPDPRADFGDIHEQLRRIINDNDDL